MKLTIARNLLGILLICTVFPPYSVGVMNLFILLPAFAGLFLLLLPITQKQLRRLGEKPRKWIVRFFCVFVIAFALLTAAEFLVIQTNIPSGNPPGDAVVIVLGAQVVNSRPTLILSGRIQAAANYLISHPDAVCIASGGQGDDEDISEAKCIRDTLVSAYGIDSSRIFLEDNSFNTNQNFINSASIIQEKKLSGNVVIATDGFHMFRAKTLAAKNGLTAYSLPASTDKRLVFYLYIREFFAIPKTLFLDR